MTTNRPRQLAGICLLGAALAISAWADAPIKVFILAGQSNMEGQGVVSMDHARHYNGGMGNLVWSMEHSASKDRMRHLRDADGNWVVRDDVEISFKVGDEVRRGGLTVGYTGYGGSSHIGPELQFGHVVGDHFDAPVLLIKTAWGGKSLQVDFRPPGAGGETGPCYRRMIAEVRDALQQLDGAPYELAAFIWMQGWNDMCSEEATAEYAQNLVAFAEDIRKEFQSPHLPFVVGELGNGGPSKPGSGMEKFREAQRRGTAAIHHAIFIPTQDFARPAELSPNTGHGHHWFGNAESYFLIGDALGKGALKLLAANDGKRIAIPGAGEMTFRRLPAGRFMMGSPVGEKDGDEDEKPVHEVVLTKPFDLGVFEVTCAQWKAVMGTLPAGAGNDPDAPVSGVTWEDCHAFIERLQTLGIGTFRLPTEAEWEYACRAGSTSRFYWGDDPDCTLADEYAWHKGNAGSRAHPVGLKKANAWGLHDMGGNVWEWCQDWYGPYPDGRQVDPRGPESGTAHVFRGNGWRWGAKFCRSANRYYHEKGHAIGLRLVLEPSARTAP